MTCLVAVAVVVGLLIGRGTKDSPAPAGGMASQPVVAMIDDSLAALNRGDWKAFATYWNDNAIIDDIGKTAMGRQEIVAYNKAVYKLGARYYRISPVIQRGNLASYAVSCPKCPFQWSGIDLLQFSKDYKMTHLWTGNTAGDVPTR